MCVSFFLPVISSLLQHQQIRRWVSMMAEWLTICVRTGSDLIERLTFCSQIKPYRNQPLTYSFDNLAAYSLTSFLFYWVGFYSSIFLSGHISTNFRIIHSYGWIDEIFSILPLVIISVFSIYSLYMICDLNRNLQ